MRDYAHVKNFCIIIIIIIKVGVTTWSDYYDAIAFVLTLSCVSCFMALVLFLIVHRCLNGRAPPYLSDHYAPVASADDRICVPPTVNCLQCLVTGSTLTAVGPFQLPAPQSGTFSRISSGTQLSVWTVSDGCLKLICSLDTSAFSVLEVLTTTALYKFTYLLTYSLLIAPPASFIVKINTKRNSSSNPNLLLVICIVITWCWSGAKLHWCRCLFSFVGIWLSSNKACLLVCRRRSYSRQPSTSVTW